MWPLWFLVQFAKNMRIEIGKLQRENLTIAKAVKAHTERLDAIEEDVRQDLVAMAELEKRLTAKLEKPKIIAKPSAPKRVNWRQAREALEKANDLPEEE